MLNNKKLFERRKRRTRHRLRKVERIKPRLSVFRSSKHIYAQVIDELEGKTVAAASTIDKDLRESLRRVQTAKPRRKSASWLPNARSQPVLRPSSSIGAVIFIMAV